MLLPIKPICERIDVRRDGTCHIYIQYFISSQKRTLLNTQIAIPPNCWNKKKLCIADDLPASLGNVNRLNIELDRIIWVVQDIVSYANRNKIEDPGAFVKQTFAPDFDSRTLNRLDTSRINDLQQEKKFSKNLYLQLDEYINSKENKVSKATTCVYNCMKKHLQAYEELRKKKISFDSFNYEFYDGFVEYLTFDYVQRRRKTIITWLKINTIAKPSNNYVYLLRAGYVEE